MARSISVAAGELSSACTGVEGRAGTPAQLVCDCERARGRLRLVDADDDRARERRDRRGAGDQHRAGRVVDEPRRNAAQERPGEPTLPMAAHGDHARLEARSLDCEERRGGPGAERRRHLNPARDVVGRVGERRPGLLAEPALRLGHLRGHDRRHRFDEAGMDHADELDSGAGRGEKRGLADGLSRLGGAVDPADDRRQDSRGVDRRYVNGMKLGHVASVRARRRRGIGECPNRTVGFPRKGAAGWRSLSTPPLRRYGRVSVRAEPEAALP